MSKNAVLTDENDEQLMPITTSENVFVSADKTLKQYLDELASGGSAYILPVASATKLGGIKVGLGFTINNDGLLSIDGNSEVFQSVSNGKAKIAAAITDKGQPTAADSTFQTMADNIALINNESIVNNAIYMTDNFFEFGSIIPFAKNVDLSLVTISTKSGSIPIRYGGYSTWVYDSWSGASLNLFRISRENHFLKDGDIISIQTGKGLLYDPQLKSVTSEIKVVIKDMFKIKEPTKCMVKKPNGINGSDVAYLQALYDFQGGSYLYAARKSLNNQYYWAIGMITAYKNAKGTVYTVPVIVSNVEDHAYITTYHNYDISDFKVVSFNYKGSTYYCNANSIVNDWDISRITYNTIPIYNTIDPDFTPNEAGWINMATKLLNWYNEEEPLPECMII